MVVLLSEGKTLEAANIRWTDAQEQLRRDSQERLRELMGAEEFQQEYEVGARLTVAGAVDLAFGAGRAAG